MLTNKQILIAFSLLLAIIAFLALISVANMAAIPKRTETDNVIKRLYSKNDLDTCLHVGMNRSDVIKTFGEPTIRQETFLHREFLMYMGVSCAQINAIDRSIPSCHFTIYLEQGNVVDWSLDWDWVRLNPWHLGPVKIIL